MKWSGLREAFGWLNAARLVVKDGSGGAGSSSAVVVDVEERNQVAVLFNWMKAELVRRQGRTAVSAVLAGGESAGRESRQSGANVSNSSQRVPQQHQLH